MRAATKQHYITYKLASTGVTYTEGTYNGITHIIVPVVLLIGNTVFWPTGADGYELVPEYVLQAAPDGWNDRAIIPVHPEELVSANTPAYLDSQCFGRVFNSHYVDGRLKAEAWLNPIAAEKIGPLATDVITRCKLGEKVEVSVGAHVAFESKYGSYNGQDFVGVWRGLVPDHLAIGLAGSEGACSVAMGCGTNRNAVKGVLDTSLDTSIREERNGDANMMKKTDLKSLRAQLRKLIANATSTRAAGTPDSEEQAELIHYQSMLTLLTAVDGFTAQARTAIDQLIAQETTDPTSTPEDESAEEEIEWALLDTVSAYLMSAIDSIYTVMNLTYASLQDKRAKEAAENAANGIVDVRIVDDARYYAGNRNNKTDAKTIQNVHDMTMQLGATCDPENATVADETKTAASKHACGCHKGDESIMATKKELVNRVIGATASPFTETDRSKLEVFEDKQLEAMATAYEVKVAVAEPVPVTPVTPAPVAQPTEAEQIAALPPALRDLVSRAAAQDAVLRGQLTTGIKAATTEYPDSDLAAMDIPSLTRLAKALKVGQPAINYSLLEAGGNPVVEPKAARKIPNSWADAVAARESKGSNVAN